MAGPTARRRRVVGLGAGVLALLVVRLVLVAPVAVSGQSMTPTVDDGAVVLVALRADPAGLGRGDVVVLRDPEGALSLKRVAGLAGDTVAILDAVLTVNGRAVDEPYLDLATVDGSFAPQVLVPGGHVYVLGDNRDRSVDSRDYGTVPLEDVLGPVLLTW
ncbi:signal peptidase I [Actinotalea ferrariae CF5-4]|uniref:Signal peptidase I n=1 Tax=Actinotalea ferrariae CF5-4 TaxID=948458 RepID=A0A021VP29_9CELL|nr:signal peptidase I [Actinotalea ferrariae]EYR62858.1 signal peptidase I [Actinotalea ferrariae CF5-4]